MYKGTVDTCHAIFSEGKPKFYWCMSSCDNLECVSSVIARQSGWKSKAPSILERLWCLLALRRSLLHRLLTESNPMDRDVVLENRHAKNRSTNRSDKRHGYSKMGVDSNIYMLDNSRCRCCTSVLPYFPFSSFNPTQQRFHAGRMCTERQ